MTQTQLVDNTQSIMTYRCQHCQKDFVKETSLAVHLCEPKRRHRERTETGVQLGLQAYLRFYELTQGSAKLKSWDDFVGSSFYRAFVKWGRYCVNIRAVNPSRFVEWLIKGNRKIDRWCSDAVYTEYLVEYLQIENVNDALSRAIEFGIDWGEKSDNPPHDCLRYGNTNAMVYAVSTGRVSAWVIYNCESGQKFLSDLNSEQIAMLWPFIDTDAWQKKFRDYPADQEYVKDILKQSGW